MRVFGGLQRLAPRLGWGGRTGIWGAAGLRERNFTEPHARALGAVFLCDPACAIAGICVRACFEAVFTIGSNTEKNGTTIQGAPRFFRLQRYAMRVIRRTFSCLQEINA
jgi:hypothetical protein